jgi:hypothetical protein
LEGRGCVRDHVTATDDLLEVGEACVETVNCAGRHNAEK